MASVSKVVESWKIVTAIDNYEEVAGEIFFRKVFTIAPEAQGLFQMLKNYGPMEEAIFADPKFKKHASGVIRFLNVAVGMIEPDLHAIVVKLKELGRKHKTYGVLEAHYPIVGEALIGTLGDALGEAFTADVKTAWVELYGVISSTMIAGAEY
mmetsp:Transcript_4471/g.6560  ORF Transcript_4471/g.6560 Transcript_4471/m.6560 type:complete len:153 (-) Transcript_4471:191-649(-)